MTLENEGNTTRLVRGWLVRLADGDLAARDALLTHTRQRLTIVAQRQFSKWPGLAALTESDDILSDAYVHLMEKWEQIITLDGEPMREPGVYFARVTTVIKNVIADTCRTHFGRRGQRTPARSLDAASAGDDDAARHDPGSDTLNPEALARFTEFHRAVEELPDGIRAVFDLRWYHGLKHEEIAAILEINEATVRRRWVDARLRLTKALPSVRFEVE